MRLVALLAAILVCPGVGFAQSAQEITIDLDSPATWEMVRVGEILASTSPTPTSLTTKCTHGTWCTGPVDLGTDASGSIYVLDNESSRIQKYRGNFDFEQTVFNSTGIPGWARSLSVSSKGDIYLLWQPLRGSQKIWQIENGAAGTLDMAGELPANSSCFLDSLGDDNLWMNCGTKWLSVANGETLELPLYSKPLRWPNKHRIETAGDDDVREIRIYANGKESRHIKLQSNRFNFPRRDTFRSRADGRVWFLSCTSSITTGPVKSGPDCKIFEIAEFGKSFRVIETKGELGPHMFSRVGLDGAFYLMPEIGSPGDIRISRWLPKPLKGPN